MRLPTRQNRDKAYYAEKSNRIWIAITDKNVKGMCKTKQRTSAINIFGEKCGSNKELFLNFTLYLG